MNKDDVITFANANPVCYLATVEGDTPRVRAVRMFKADERGILIQTMNMKDLYNQLVVNGKVELCFNSPDKQVRVKGTAEFLEEQSVKEEVLKARPFLKGLVDAQGWDVIKVFRVANAEAFVWTMATNLAPKEYIKL